MDASRLHQASRRGGSARRRAEPPRVPPSAVRWAAIAAIYVNLGIHLALAPMHIREMPYIGVLFVLAAIALGAIMVGLASDRDSMRAAAWVAGSVVCTLEFVLFVISRTGGLPLGYRETWTGSVEDMLGLCSLSVELVFIGCAVSSSTTAPRITQSTRLVAWVPWHDRTTPLG